MNHASDIRVLLLEDDADLAGRTRVVYVFAASALIAVAPGATAETSPFAATTATFGFALCQVIVRLVSGLPVESITTAVAWAVCPTNTAAGEIATERAATGVGVGVETVNVVCPLTPSAAAVTTVVPGAMATITPESFAVATATLDVDQATARSLRIAPLASLTVAVAR
jgi:hypothetical protein